MSEIVCYTRVSLKLFLSLQVGSRNWSSALFGFFFSCGSHYFWLARMGFFHLRIFPHRSDLILIIVFTNDFGLVVVYEGRVTLPNSIISNLHDSDILFRQRSIFKEVREKRNERYCNAELRNNKYYEQPIYIPNDRLNVLTITKYFGGAEK